jgi:DNA ligase 1
MPIFKPMLAGKSDLSLQRFPVLASAKLDGVRCLAMGGRPMSRAMKPLTNRFVQAWFAANAEVLQGLDGELIVGPPNADDVLRMTSGAVRREDQEPDFTFYVFDRWDSDLPYQQRVALMPPAIDRVTYLEFEVLHSIEELNDFEQRMLDLGYEGAILRDPNGPYKQGRSSTNEGYLLKVKRYEDAEAVIVGFVEEMFNGNEATTNELGRTKRSSHQANKTGKGTLGTLLVRGVTAFEGLEFPVGGFNAALRAEIWNNQAKYLGQMIKYKYFPIGIKDKPRHGNFLAFRDPSDMSSDMGASMLDLIR